MAGTIWDLDVVLPFNACKVPLDPAGFPTGDPIVPIAPGQIPTGDEVVSLAASVIVVGDLIDALPAGVITVGDALAALAIPTITSSEKSPEAESPATLGPEKLPVPANTIILGDLLPSIAQPGPPYPLNHARIGYDNVIAGNIETLTTAQDQEGAVFATTPATWERWRPGADATLDIEIIQPSDVDYIGIAAHTLGSTGATIAVSLQEAFGDPFILLTNIAPLSDDAIFISLPEQQVKTIRLAVTGTSAGFEIGVIYAGVALQMIRPLYGGHTPIVLSAENTYLPNKSDKGQFLGRDVIRQGYATSASFKNLPADWYRTDFQPFVVHAQTLPYFWAWNLLEFPEEVAYVWSNADIAPTNAGTRDLMTVSWRMEGHR